MLDNPRRKPRFWIAIAALALTSATVSPGPDDDIAPDDPSYFQFARIKFNESGRFFWAGWAHDYPRAERNLLKILSEVTVFDGLLEILVCGGQHPDVHLDFRVPPNSVESPFL